MIDKILIEKLKVFIKKNELFESEEDIMYFLITIRKIIDSTSLKTQYPLIKFYADWSVHDKKDQHNENFLPVLKKIDKIINPSSLNEFNPYYDVMDFKKLRIELRKFFRKQSIHKRFSESLWWHFQIQLSNLLNSQPLDCSRIDETTIKSMVYSVNQNEIILRIYYKDPWRLPQNIGIIIGESTFPEKVKI